ncbi:MAG: hypothetical protein LBU21_07570, partial [Treponema sp.]|nr:hypothetical protein [Treponema sp.]
MNESPKNGSFFVKKALLAILLTYFPVFSGAVEVDTTELDKSGSTPVIFINYEGPHARIETRNQIRNIGFS